MRNYSLAESPVTEAPRAVFEHRTLVYLCTNAIDGNGTLIEYWSHLLLLLKKVGSARLRESDIHPISPKTSAPQYQPIDRKKRK